MGERFDYRLQKRIDIRAAGSIMLLVLNCDEICDITHYWDNVAFVAKYDKATKTIEICDKEKGIYEFHKLLQDSVDL